MNENTMQKNRHISNYVLNILGIIMCVFIIPVLVVNVTLIIKSWAIKNKVPNFIGFFPMIVLTHSMEGVFNSGDLIICKTIDPEDIQVGDIISFVDPDSVDHCIVTHRVEEITTVDGELMFVTKGDSNNTVDRSPVSAESVEGIYKFRLAGLGNVAMFMQTTPGLLVCIVLPAGILLGINMLISRKKRGNPDEENTEALKAELEKLKSQLENDNKQDSAVDN